MEYCFDSNIDIILRCLHGLDRSRFDELVDSCIETINHNGKIVFSGLGKNAPICEKVAGSLRSIGIKSIQINTNEALHGDLGNVCNNDIVIVVSKSGISQETLSLCRHLKTKPNIKVWGITFCEDTEFTNILDKCIILQLDVEGDSWNIMPMNSSVVILLLLQALALEIIAKMNKSLSDFLCNHPGGGVGQKIEKFL